MSKSDSYHSSAQLQEAAIRFARLRADDVSDAERRDHEEWLNRDSANPAAFREIERRWAATDALRDRVQATFDPETTAAAWRTSSTAANSRRWLPVAAALAGVVASLSLVFFALSEDMTYVTGTGEQRHLRLPDQSVVALNTGTEIEISMTPIHRELVLRHGEAYFDVHSESLRRFIVRTPQLKIRSIGTKFNVLRTPSKTYVTVLEGRVAVTDATGASARSGTGEIMVRAGERGVFEEGRSAQVGPAADRERIQAWQRGEILFDRTRLSDVSQELSRYLGIELRVDQRVADETVSGIFRADQPRAALAAIERALPVRTHTLDSGQTIVIEPTNDD